MVPIHKTIPSLKTEESIRRWAAMESAKRRLLLQLSDLGLPPFIDSLTESHPLQFEFLEDTVDAQGKTRRVTTGHELGVITINLARSGQCASRKASGPA